MTITETDEIEAQVRQWVERTVVGLNLCPFAASFDRARRLRIVCSEALDHQAVLADLRRELEFLGDHAPADLETTILVIPFALSCFIEYNDFLDRVDALLSEGGWSEHFQVASFHPRYRFADSAEDCVDNFTNRSPYPLLHLLRETSITHALEAVPDAGDRVPAANVRRLRSLDAQTLRRHWPWLF